MQYSTAQFLVYLHALGYDLERNLYPVALACLAQTLMDIDVSRLIDAEHYERSGSRIAYRNGYRQRRWKTPVGKVRLNIPKLRSGSYTPEFINTHLAETLLLMVQSALVYGADTVDIAAVLRDSGVIEITPYEAMQVQLALSDVVQVVHNRPITDDYPYLWLDTVELCSDDNGHMMPRRAAIAIGLTADGDAQVLGFEVGTGADDIFFWRMFLQKLVNRGLADVRLVMSDEYRGVRVAVDDVLGVEWRFSQRNAAIRQILDDVPQDEHSEVIAAIATTFIQSDRVLAQVQLSKVRSDFSMRFPAAMITLDDVRELLLPASADDAVLIAFADTLLRVKQALSREVNAIAIAIVEGVGGVDLAGEVAVPQPIMILG